MKKIPKEQNKFATSNSLMPPDGKYGWIIVLSYAIANVSYNEKIIFF